jgi:hypothetical protein
METNVLVVGLLPTGVFTFNRPTANFKAKLNALVVIPRVKTNNVKGKVELYILTVACIFNKQGTQAIQQVRG